MEWAGLMCPILHSFNTQPCGPFFSYICNNSADKIETWLHTQNVTSVCYFYCISYIILDDMQQENLEFKKKEKKNSMVWVRERTIPTTEAVQKFETIRKKSSGTPRSNFSLSDLNQPQPGGPRSCIYLSQKHSSSVIITEALGLRQNTESLYIYIYIWNWTRC
jgi:hypothetical protein